MRTSRTVVHRLLDHAQQEKPRRGRASAREFLDGGIGAHRASSRHRAAERLRLRWALPEVLRRAALLQTVRSLRAFTAIPVHQAAQTARRLQG